jgi:hypothetical protein
VRVVARAAALCAILFVGACGGSDDKGGNGTSNPLPLKGGERLTWDQNAGSVQALRAHTYRLYIDGNRGTFADVRCSEIRGAAGYECSGLLPGMTAGRHSLELTSVVNNVESPRSAPIAVSLAASTTGPVSVVPGSFSSPATGATQVRPACVLASSASGCFNVHVLASDLDSPSALSPTPDGRLFFIERSSRVRVIAEGVLMSESALELPHPAARFVGLAVDSSFGRTHSVFVAWTEAGRDGIPTLNITRYRELQNQLGEGATIVSGLASPPDVVTPLVVDRDSLLYVAVPGAVLRFTRDGSVPFANLGASPIIAKTLARPSALAVDADGQRVWLAGQEAGHLSVTSFAVLSRRDDSRRLTDVTRASLANDLFNLDSANPMPVLAIPVEDGRVLLTAGGRLFSGRLTIGGQFVQMEELQLKDGDIAFAAAAGPAGSWYLLTGPEETSLTLRLIRRE